MNDILDTDIAVIGAGTAVAAIGAGSVHALVDAFGMILGGVLYALSFDWVSQSILPVRAGVRCNCPSCSESARRSSSSPSCSSCS